MNNIIKSTTLALFIFGLCCTSLQAQGKSQEKKSEIKEKKEKINDKEADINESKKEAKELKKELRKEEKALRKEEKELKKEAKEETGDVADDLDGPKRVKEAKEAKEKENKGNAYGRDKGDMTGREFGQYRASMAKEKAEETDRSFREKEEMV